MANEYVSTAKVRLYDQRSNTILLHPETELSVVQCSSGGLLTITGNSIYVASAAVVATIASEGYIKEPLLEYTSSGSVTNIGVSTGYGTLLHVISTTDTVRLPATSASNDLIPTEKAVAIGLERKQNTLLPGDFITITADGAGHDVVAVKALAQIDGATVSLDSVVPTAAAVNLAILAASGSAVSTAVTSVTTLGYATQTWTQQNFVSKGSVGDWGYADYTTAGVVRPVQGSGLQVGDSGALSVAPAASNTIGGVMVPTGYGLSIAGTGALALNAAGTVAAELGGVYVPISSGLHLDVDGALTGDYAGLIGAYGVTQPGMVKGVLTAVTSTAATAYVSSAYVPTVQAVWDYGHTISSSITGPGGDLDILITGTTNWVYSNFISSGTVTNWGSATYTSHGVVRIASDGLSVTGGTLSLDVADVRSSYALADEAEIGGVVVVTNIPTTATAIYTSSAYVPNVEAVRAYVTGNFVSTGSITDWGYATTGSHGVVQINDEGLSVTGGMLSLDTAAACATYTAADAADIGGVVVITDIPSTATAAYSDAAYVPNVEAVINYVTAAKGGTATYAAHGYVQVDSNSLQVSNGLLRISATSGLYTSGGLTGGTIFVSAGEGIQIDTTKNAVALRNASVNSTYVKAAGSTIGGVRVVDSIPSAATAAYAHSAYVPNVEAVITTVAGATNALKNYVDGAIADLDLYEYAGDFKVTKASGTDNFHIATGRVYINGSTASFGTGDSDTIELENVGTIWLNLYSTQDSVSIDGYSYSDAWVYDDTHTSIPIAKVSDGEVVQQFQHGPITLAGPPGTVAGQGTGGGGTDYFGDFKCSISGNSITATAGNVYSDTGALLVGGSTPTALTPITDITTAWLIVNKGNATYTTRIAGTPSTAALDYSVPLAGIAGSTVCQYQHGPVVVRGRWL